MSKSIKFFVFLCLSFNLLLSTGCGKDDEEETCANFPVISGNVNIDGETLSLSVAQLLIQAGGSSFGDSYLFQIGGISSDCNTLKTVNFNVSVPSGEDVSGTYAIKEFFDAGDNDATGSFINQTVNPVGQVLKDLVSGSVTIVNEGGDKYDINLNAGIVGGSSVSLAINHQF